MSLLLKDPAASLDYVVDWGADWLAGDVLTASNWSIDPAHVGGMSKVNDSFDLQTTRVQLAGGLSGVVYRATNDITSSTGRQDSRSLVVRVGER